MDFQRLLKELPSVPYSWSTQQVCVWLNIIDLPNLQGAIRENKFDGKWLMSIGSINQELAYKLGITSSIVIKKLNLWLGDVFYQYFNFLSKKSFYKTRKVPDGKNVYSKMKFQQQKNRIHIEQEYQIPADHELFFCNQEARSTKMLHVNKIPVTRIGRQLENQIVLGKPQLSRQHAVIKYQKQRFYLLDRNSCEGTYVKINKQIQITEGSVIVLGQTQIIFSVNSSNLVVYFESRSKSQLLLFNQKNQYTLGTHRDNDFPLAQDLFLSEFHGFIYKNIKNNRFYYQDYSASNVSWFQLEPESQYFDNKVPIYNGMIIKFSDLVFRLKFIQKSAALPFLSDKNTCVICFTNMRDSYIEPCHHYCACLSCLKGLRFCPICKGQNKGSFRLYNY